MSAARKIAARAITAGELITPDAYLTGRELKFIESLKRSTRLKVVASMNQLTEATAKRYAVTMYRKVGVNSIADLVVWAVKHGLISFGESKEGKEQCQQLISPN